MRNYLVIWLLFFGGLAVAMADDLQGKVLWVYDGDTFKMETSQGVVKIRLYGIDAPEKGQRFADESRQQLIHLIGGRMVTVSTESVDPHHRIVGVVTNDGVNVNLKMIEAGMAWWSRRFAPKNTDYAQAETSARAEKRGLWRDDSQIAPWDWKKATKDAANAGR